MTERSVEESPFEDAVPRMRPSGEAPGTDAGLTRSPRPGPRSPKADEEAEARRPSRWSVVRRTVCRLLTAHPEKNLARAVCNYLAQEMPDMEFTLRPTDPAQAVWICGYEEGQVELIQQARRDAPEALIVVTGRAPLAAWREEAVEAGADHACAWPLPYSELARLLHDKRSQAIA